MPDLRALLQALTPSVPLPEATTTNLQFRCINDADSAANNFLTVTRSGYVPTSITLDATTISLNGEVGFNGTAPISKPTVTGSKGGNAALASLITALASYGLITDSTT